MKRRIALLIEYDGTAYSGWQRQKEEKTVQGTLENALEEVLSERVSLRGASRTDAGVHALGQVAAFTTTRDRAPEVLVRALNALLPVDIRVKGACEVPLKFNPQREAVRKTYMYLIYEGFKPPPFLHRYVWTLPQGVDHTLMEEIASFWVGEHDFKYFMNTGTRVRTTVRRVERIKVKRDGPLIAFFITANAFLKQMVRNMVGSLIALQRGKLTKAELVSLKPGDQIRGFRYTAPPQGLFLLNIEFKYPLLLTSKEDMIFQKLKEWGDV